MLNNNLLRLARMVNQVEINNEVGYVHHPIASEWMEVLENIPNPISRKHILEFSEHINLEDAEQIKQFILMVLIWGYGDRGDHGNVENILSTPIEDIIRIFRETFDFLGINNENSIRQAFEKLNEKRNGTKIINGLNMSFISKYFYFIGKPRMKTKYPLIFDNKVNRALIRLSMTL
ncbi:MAG: hypothetical protein Q8S01_11465, partial [Ignavibacteria bacterium]|nr:hypothetical protein [Ignavibacteria bacterium]